MSSKNRVSANKAIQRLTDYISFGEMLLSFRLAQEITQIEMAEKLKISKQDLCNIEKGRKIVSVERAVSFAKTLKMPAKTFAKYVLQDQLQKAGIKGKVEITSRP
ncbi:MAG: helix-turn-helix domain-containing protein [Bacteriovoracaceae bacterium]|nr:helix-turn-helix domain-containing protein [Bacteriovoracaceae bacterium]